MTPAELLENFSYLTQWEDKYRYLIELGDALPPFPEEDKIPANKVDGCQSQVWLTHRARDGKHFFQATSDAHIVRGLQAVLLTFVNGRTSAEISSLALPDIFAQLGLSEQLSPTRRQGFFAMVERIGRLAAAAEKESVR